jgi:hypothetical protein
VDHLFRINDLAAFLGVFAAFFKILLQDQLVSGGKKRNASWSRRFPGFCATPNPPSGQAGTARYL